MPNVVVRGQAARVLEALARQPGGTWLDVWTELVAIQHERAALAVPPGQIGLHCFKVDNGSAKYVFGVNRHPLTRLSSSESTSSPRESHDGNVAEINEWARTLIRLTQN